MRVPAGLPESPGEVPAPCANAEAGVHEAAHRLIEPLERGKLYDLAAGEGALSHWAAGRRFDVTAVDLGPSAYTGRHVRFVQADLNRELPLPDGEAAVVAAIEVIEHLENHFAFLREAARVLRPGGRLVLSTPNEHAAQNRWSYFRTGFFGASREVIREDDPVFPGRHIHMAPLPQLELAWRRAGFALERWTVSRLGPGSLPFLPLYPLQVLSLRRRMLGPRVPPEARELNRRLLPLFADLRIFLARVVVFCLRKAG